MKKFLKGLCGLLACSILLSIPAQVSATEIPADTNLGKEESSYIKKIDLDTYCQSVAELEGITIEEARDNYYTTIVKHIESFASDSSSSRSIDLGYPNPDGSSGSVYYASFIVYKTSEPIPMGSVQLEMTTPCIVYSHPSIGYEFVDVTDNVNVVITNNGRHTVVMSSSAAQKIDYAQATMRARIVLDCEVQAGASAGWSALGFDISITGHARKPLTLSHLEKLTHR